MALLTQLEQLPLIRGQQLPSLVHQFLGGDVLAGTRTARSERALVRRDLREAPVIALARLLPQGQIDEMMPGHGSQEPEHLFGCATLVLAAGDAHQEVQQDGLAHVRRIEQSPEVPVAQPQANHSSQGRLINPHQFRRRVLISRSHSAEQGAQVLSVGHDWLL
jgi:hypothetical protein